MKRMMEEIGKPPDFNEEEIEVVEVERLEDEGRDPLTILPEEVWEIILCMLKDSPSDLISCCRASLSWDFILKSSKSTWMFDHIFPFVYSYLKKKDILNCRRVCKHWRKGVDDFIENHPCYRPSVTAEAHDGDIGRESVYYPLISKQLFQVRFIEAEQLSRFRSVMEHHPRNPLIGRSVSFYSRINDEWMMNALHFLSAFGRHIWYFSFESAHAPIRFIQWLRQCLALLPNLRRLHIISLVNNQNQNEGEENRDENAAEGLEELMEELNANPLPPLPRLEILEVCTHNLARMIQDSLLAAYVEQIHRLQLNEWNEIYTVEESYPFGNLKELNLTIDSNACLSNLLELTCPYLRKLNLTLRYNDIDLGTLYRVMQKFGDTLYVLKISISSGAAFKQDFLEDDDLLAKLYFTKLDMPCLKTLVLVNFSNLTYNFLVGMRVLQYLHVERWSLDSELMFDSDYEMVEFVEFINNNQLYEANIWKVLPDLKQVTYHDVTKSPKKFTRRMHEFVRRKRIQEKIPK